MNETSSSSPPILQSMRMVVSVVVGMVVLRGMVVLVGMVLKGWLMAILGSRSNLLQSIVVVFSCFIREPCDLIPSEVFGSLPLYPPTLVLSVTASTSETDPNWRNRHIPVVYISSDSEAESRYKSPKNKLNELFYCHAAAIGVPAFILYDNRCNMSFSRWQMVE